MSELPKKPVSGNFKFYPNTVCRAFLNDIPVFQGFEGHGFSHDGGINHFLVPGENELKLEILAAPKPEGGRLAYQEPPEGSQMGKRDTNQSVAITIYKEIFDDNDNGTGEFDIIYHCQFPDLWQHVPEKFRQLPYMHVVKFDPKIHLKELAFLSAPMNPVDCEGTPELRDAVNELHQAFSLRDSTRLKDLMQLQIQEYDGAYYGGSVAEQMSAIDELLSDNIVVAPLDWNQMHFHARAGGRLVHVERLDRQPVLGVQTIGKPKGHMSDPVFTHHEGRWQLM